MYPPTINRKETGVLPVYLLDFSKAICADSYLNDRDTLLHATSNPETPKLFGDKERHAAFFFSFFLSSYFFFFSRKEKETENVIATIAVSAHAAADCYGNLGLGHSQ